MFIARMGRSIIKRTYFGSHFHSRKMRNRAHAEVLEKSGDQILIIELEGPLFFGSAENLASKIEAMVAKTQYCILNFKRINDIDSTGANIIAQIKRRLEAANKYLLLCHLRENKPLWNFLEIMYAGEILNSPRIFADTDTALEWAEDHLLSNADLDDRSDLKTDLAQIELFNDFSPEELKIIKSRLAPQTYGQGQLVFNEGDETRDLYLLTKGSMSVKIHLPESNRHKRIYTYTSGVVFGELSFLDGSSRSASVWSHEDSELLCLTFRQFETLRSEHPKIATKLITNLSLEISRRLRRTSNQLRLLEES
jgi:SulP family sulfate permease